MRHEIYQQYVSQFVDGELKESLEEELFVHLGSCRDCRRFLRTSWQVQLDIQHQKPQSSRLPKGTISTPGSVRFGDRSPVISQPFPKDTRLSFRTFVLALVVILFGCVVLSSRITLNEAMLPPAVSGQSGPIDTYR